ncbi:hypothetical protein ASPWEDRAFT_42797 [Aspergillus wentii DTO 134E9]|uniref:Uncharacterized protein n=1 Tax=Aspergillus wentii DTO 134E9 TaxID=1073089 RepID=A0A1L9RCX0_ASPWE|nr:uncharacterized protein ASPWEDRAFT_42797 [Aspergillus wentii DTO 134E9]KAI9933043.1 hypothetical protein MW887_007514 [Aspergillus wentii]OJJ32765.1 hypothetical protein ASPWEDRAFT_42797 [Aspergillus wentii DTO 134E9]
MVSIKAVLVAALTATTTMATPTPPSSNIISQNYICAKGQFNNGTVLGHIPQSKVNAEYNEAGTKTGASGYPKKFENKDKLHLAPGCGTDAGLWELPVLDGGKPYDYNKTDANPGLMRVYYTTELRFCGIGVEGDADKADPDHLCRVECPNCLQSAPPQ